MELLLARRRLLTAKASLIDFTEYTFPRYVTGDFHRRVAARLESVERGEIDRLMLPAPPRHGKSELTSIRFVAWYLGRNPHKSVISASASEPLATDFGRQVRDLVRLQEYQRVFPGVDLQEDNQAAGRWRTKDGGGYYAVGVGTQIMGRGGDLNLIDDPFGTWEEAQSATVQKRVFDWYRGSLYNRLEPNAAIVIIGHRMNEMDLSGQLLDATAGGADEWVVDPFPAERGGVALCPERYPIEALMRIKANTEPRMWSSLYQQDPQPDEGTFFKRDWFKRYDTLPKVNLFGSSDFAVTDAGGDFTEHAIWGVGPDSTIYAVDWWRGQTDASVWIEKWLDLILKHKPLGWFAESGVIKRALESVLNKRMQDRRAWATIEWAASIHDKPTRARAFQALAANGKVAFPQAPWANDVLDQLIRFPAGKHDDAVDCCSLIGRAVYDAHPAIITPAVNPGRPNDRYTRNRGGAESWKTV